MTATAAFVAAAVTLPVGGAFRCPALMTQAAVPESGLLPWLVVAGPLLNLQWLLLSLKLECC